MNGPEKSVVVGESKTKHQVLKKLQKLTSFDMLLQQDKPLTTVFLLYFRYAWQEKFR